MIQKTCSEKIWPFELWLNGFELSLNAFQKHKETKPLQIQWFYLLQNNSFPLFWIVVDLFWIVIGCSSKAQTKQTLTNSKKNTFFQNSCFLFKPLLKNCKKQVHKGYPLAGPCICNYKLKWTFAIKNNLFGSTVFFFSFFLLLLIVVESFWIVIGCSSKAQTKQTLTNSKKNTFFQNSCFLFKPLLKNCKKQVHKGYPLAGPCICNYKLKWTFAIKNNLFGSTVFFFSFFLLLLIVVESFWIVIGCSSKAQTKQTFTD